MRTLITTIIMIIALLVAIAFYTLLERKVMGGIQRRTGPAKAGPFGILQPISDALKLMQKQVITYTYLFLLSSAFFFIVNFSLWFFIPFVSFLHTSNVPLGLLSVFALSSISIYGLILGGWASNSKYAFLGALRSTAQMISYEILFGLIFLTYGCLIGSISFLDILKAQEYIWFCFPLWPLMFCFFIAMLAETNRVPFDLPEAEAEIVAGYNVEYSGIPFAFFFLAEYSNMLLYSALFSILFLGGGSPFFFSYFELCFFVIKLLFIAFLFVLVRAALPRIRYDQLMLKSWTFFMPIIFVLFTFIFLPFIFFCLLETQIYPFHIWYLYYVDFCVLWQKIENLDPSLTGFPRYVSRLINRMTSRVDFWLVIMPPIFFSRANKDTNRWEFSLLKIFIIRPLLKFCRSIQYWFRQRWYKFVFWYYYHNIFGYILFAICFLFVEYNIYWYCYQHDYIYIAELHESSSYWEIDNNTLRWRRVKAEERPWLEFFNLWEAKWKIFLENSFASDDVWYYYPQDDVDEIYNSLLEFDKNYPNYEYYPYIDEDPDDWIENTELGTDFLNAFYDIWEEFIWEETPEDYLDFWEYELEDYWTDLDDDYKIWLSELSDWPYPPTEKFWWSALDDEDDVEHLISYTWADHRQSAEYLNARAKFYSIYKNFLQNPGIVYTIEYLDDFFVKSTQLPDFFSKVCCMGGDLTKIYPDVLVRNVEDEWDTSIFNEFIEDWLAEPEIKFYLNELILRQQDISLNVIYLDQFDWWEYEFFHKMLRPDGWIDQEVPDLNFTRQDLNIFEEWENVLEQPWQWKEILYQFVEESLFGMWEELDNNEYCWYLNEHGWFEDEYEDDIFGELLVEVVPEKNSFLQKGPFFSLWWFICIYIFFEWLLFGISMCAPGGIYAVHLYIQGGIFGGWIADAFYKTVTFPQHFSKTEIFTTTAHLSQQPEDPVVAHEETNRLLYENYTTETEYAREEGMEEYEETGVAFEDVDDEKDGFTLDELLHEKDEFWRIHLEPVCTRQEVIEWHTKCLEEMKKRGDSETVLVFCDKLDKKTNSTDLVVVNEKNIIREPDGLPDIYKEDFEPKSMFSLEDYYCVATHEDGGTEFEKEEKSVDELDLKWSAMDSMDSSAYECLYEVDNCDHDLEREDLQTRWYFYMHFDDLLEQCKQKNLGILFELVHFLNWPEKFRKQIATYTTLKEEEELKKFKKKFSTRLRHRGSRRSIKINNPKNYKYNTILEVKPPKKKNE